MAGAGFPIQEYSFPALDQAAASQGNSSIQSFKVAELNIPDSLTEQKDRQTQRQTAKAQNFKIEPMVMQYRGFQQQEEEEYQTRLDQGVQQRLIEVEEEARQRGHQEGLTQGKKEVFEQMRAAAEEKMAALTEMVNSILPHKADIIREQKNQICTLIKHLTRWVILRELKDDDQYLARLVEAAAVELLQGNDHLTVRIREEDFARLESLLPILQEKLPQVIFKAEVEANLKGEGVIIESENGIINATLDEQLQAIDRVFATIEKK